MKVFQVIAAKPMVLSSSMLGSDFKVELLVLAVTFVMMSSVQQELSISGCR